MSYFLRKTYWVRDYLKGSPVFSHYNDIRVIMEAPAIGKERRGRYLDSLLKYAIQNCPYYKQYKFADLHDFPVVNKSVLLENYDRIKIAPDKIPNQEGAVFIQTTSGSTGTPFAVPQDTRKRNRRIAELKYFGEKNGFKSHDKLVHLRTWNKWQGKSWLRAVRENIIPFDISRMDDERLKKLCTIIDKYEVVVLRGYASSIDLLVRYVIKNELKLPSLKLIIAGSESLQESTRELVEKFIGCNIISQYANEENGILAQEQVLKESRSPFHLNVASYFFEILKLDEDEPAQYGELGRIVVTDLFNYAFPMIRYDTGDTGIMCEAGGHSSGYPVISTLYGRRMDLVFDTKGNAVHPMTISRILKHYSEILQWQFIQNNKEKYLLRLTTISKNFSCHEIESELLTVFGVNANIEFELADEIRVLSSGKRKPIINNWKV